MLFIPTPLLELAVLLPIPGGGGILKVLLPAGFIGGGAMLNVEYGLLWVCTGAGEMAGAKAEKFDSLPVVLDADDDDVSPHGFDVMELPPALLQSIPELCVLV